MVEPLVPEVSVVIIVKNAQVYIGACINSILGQTFKNFEVVIIDDLSTDNTNKIIEGFKDKRIKYYRNPVWLGISKSRNKGVQNAIGEYIFFTDGDCTVVPNWLEEGLKYLKISDCVGVEGKIVYVSEDFEPTFSDCVMENKAGGNFMTGNMAYRKDVVVVVGGFDEKLDYLEDRDIALRVMKYGKILFNPAMVVYHPRVKLTLKRYIGVASRTRNRVHLFRKTGEKKFMLGRILFPLNLLLILFPPLVFSSFIINRFKTIDDFNLFPYFYLYLVCERLNIWKESINSRVFII